MSGKEKRQHWWYWKRSRARLVKWTKALLQGRRYTVRVAPFGQNGTAYHDPKNKVIQANPQFFAPQPVQAQFRATQGMLAHEVGHVFFTHAWPSSPGGALQWLANALEDERIERAICTYYPGIAAAIQLLGDLMYERTKTLDLAFGENQKEALACCLPWRWAHARFDEADMLDRLGITSRTSRDLWHQIKPRVEEAWRAPDTRRVIQIAEEILAILDLPAESSLPPLPLFKIGKGTDDGIPQKREGEPLPLPVEAFDGASPGTGTDFDEDHVPLPEDDSYSEPAPYRQVEDQAAPLARQLVEALKVPRPRVRSLPHRWRGRYSFRQETRTPSTPHLRQVGVGKDKGDVVFYVLVDRSGSMNSVQESVRLALMTVYLATTQLGIPLGMAYFGSGTIVPGQETLEISPVRTRAYEETKSLIAGFKGATGAEFLDWGLALAEKALRHRPERRKIVLVIHDGEPVYEGDRGNDFAMSLDRLRGFERKGLTPLGLYLGDDYDPQLAELFPRLLVTQGRRLPEKLGNMIRSLV